MTAPRYVSAWGAEPDEHVDNVSEKVARGAEPIQEVAVRSLGSRPSPGSDTDNSASLECRATATFSAALAAALMVAGPPHRSWGALAQQLGIHNSVLRRMRLQQGVSSATMDRVAKVLKWTITISPRS
jgi:hypothetical protein